MLLSPGCGCCIPCCVVARVIVRECDSGVLVDGATVVVKDDDDDTVATGLTDETGTVALDLPRYPGRVYEVEVTRPPIEGDPDPPVGDETESLTVRKRLVSRCGVNGITISFNSVQEACFYVVDQASGNPVSGIPVSLTVTTGLTTRTVGHGVSDESGRVCITIDAGGFYGVMVNVTAGEDEANPDYGTSGVSELLIPNCGPFEETLQVALVESNVGCIMVLVLGCHCGLAGTSVTLKGKVRRNTDATGTFFLSAPQVTDDWSITGTTDSNGRIWFCPQELDEEDDPPAGNVVYGGVPSITGVFYDSDADQHDYYYYTAMDVVGPSPYVPKYDEPLRFTSQPDVGWLWHARVYLYTPDGHFCRGPSRCLEEFPASLTVTVDGFGTHTLTSGGPYGGFGPGSYTKCFNIGFITYIMYAGVNRMDFKCTPTTWRGTHVSIRRFYWTCGVPVPPNVGIISERVFDLWPISGTDACPVDVQLRTGFDFWNGATWVWVWGSTYGSITE